MKKYVISFLALMSPLTLTSTNAFAQTEIKHEVDANFFHGLPNDLHLGEAAGVAVNSKGRIAIYSRGNSTGPAYGATASQVLEFDPTGKFIREVGHNLYAWSFAHAIRYDKDDNLWAIDKGSDMIVKFNPEGRVTMVFGRKKEASDEGAEAWKHPNPPLPAGNGQFRQPTDVAWDNEGNIFIGDGYINSRIAKYDKNGHWVKQWGDRGSEEGKFNTVHSVTSDNKGNIYVADRGNRRVQVFDNDGKLLRVMTINVPFPAGIQPWYGPMPTPQAPAMMQMGAPWAVCITPGSGTQYLFVADGYPGRVYKMTLEGKVLGFFGSAGRMPGETGWTHELACPNENTVYTAEILNWRVQKWTLHPDASQR